MSRDADMLRMFVECRLEAGARVAIDRAQAHYLGHVMRRGIGDPLLVFNGRDGEWRARMDVLGKDGGALIVAEVTRQQASEPDLWILFAPVKRTPIDRIARAATELGASRLAPVLTRHTVARRINTTRLRANAREAAEQCGRLSVPEVADPASLTAALKEWPADRRLVVADETGAGAAIADALIALGCVRPVPPSAILTGPEGGFAGPELDALGDLPFVTRVRLGPRILRAETAVLSALACWQALVGDWRGDGAAPGGP
jgi:16S rRNA (uracil1498-N3)-methyltransferase